MRLRLPAFGPAQMVLTLAILLLGLFAYAFLQTAAQSYRLRESERVLHQEVQMLHEQRAELEGLAAYLESDEYVEAFARQQFGLVKPGETSVIVDAPAMSGTTRHPGERWWEALFDTEAAATPTSAASSAGAASEGGDDPGRGELADDGAPDVVEDEDSP